MSKLGLLLLTGCRADNMLDVQLFLNQYSYFELWQMRSMTKQLDTWHIASPAALTKQFETRLVCKVIKQDTSERIDIEPFCSTACCELFIRCLV